MHILNCIWLQIHSQLEGSVLPSASPLLILMTSYRGLKTITFTSLLCTCQINIVKWRIKFLLIELLLYTMIKTGRYFKHQPVATLCNHFWMLLISHPSRSALLAGGLLLQGPLQGHLVSMSSIFRPLILADVHQILAWLHTGGQIKVLSQTP